MKIALKAFLISLIIFFAGKGVRLLKSQQGLEHLNVQVAQKVTIHTPSPTLTGESTAPQMAIQTPVEKKVVGPQPKQAQKKPSFKWLTTKFEPNHFDTSDEQYVQDVEVTTQGSPPLTWLTTPFEPNYFDTSDKLYAQDSEVTIQFDPIDHRRLLKNYRMAIAQLQLESRPTSPPSPPLMAQNGPEQVIVEDRVDEKIAQHHEVSSLERERDVPEQQIDTRSKPPPGRRAGGAAGPKYNPFLSTTYGEKIPDPALEVKVKQVKTITPKRIPAPVTGRSPTKQLKGRPESSHAITRVTTQVFSFGEGPGKGHSNFEILPDYSSSERWRDQGTGEVSIQRQLNSGKGVIGALLHGQGIMDIRIDVALEQGVNKEMSVPVLPRDDLEDLLSERGLSGEGGMLLVELDSSTESINIDAQYEHVIHLDSKWRPVSVADDYLYMLFLGVTPGSTTIEYIRNGYENLKKVVLIEARTIYYNSNEYTEVGRDIVQIGQRNTLGHYKSDLNIQGADIVQFNSYEKVSQIGPSEYDLSVNVIPTGTRKYVELNHLSSPIYLGRWDAKKVVIPSENYIAQFLKAVNLDDLSGSCLIQVNFAERVAELYIEGKNGEDYIPIDRIYIDRDGQFSETLSPLSVQGFFLSDQTGVVSMNVRYENGKHDYLNSYCASSAYIIEQL